MIRLGMLDFDTSHSIEFVRRLNQVDIEEDQWVEGARVVVGCPGESRIAPERIPEFAEQIGAIGVPLVDDPMEMIGRVDGMLIESLAGDAHYDRAAPFLETGIPCFVDKPFTCSTADARRLIDLAIRKNVPLFSSSSLRYAPELLAFLADESHGPIHGAEAYGPAPLLDGNPGLFHYGLHSIETLYTLLGPGCQRVRCIHQPGTDIVIGEWNDGRLGTVRGIRTGERVFGAIAFTEHSVVTIPIEIRYIYRELLKQIVAMFQTGVSPLDTNITLELVAFIEAANASALNGGRDCALTL